MILILHFSIFKFDISDLNQNKLFIVLWYNIHDAIESHIKNGTIFSAQLFLEMVIKRIRTQIFKNLYASLL
jgi:hypothetical protein